MKVKNSYLLLLTMVLASCAYAPWEKSSVKVGTPEEKVAAVQKRADVKADAVLETTIRRKDLLVTKELAVKQLAEQADLAKEKGQLDEADIIYDRILSFLPEDPNAIKSKVLISQQKEQDKKLQQAAELFAEKKFELAREMVREVLMENPQHVKAIELQHQLEAQTNPVKIAPPSLKPPFDKLVSLELRDANIKVVFEALSRATGINFILDKDIKPDSKATIFIKKARIDEAIDMVLSSNGLQKKALSDNTALVFPSTPQKLKDYKDLVIRSFFFTNTNAKQVSTLLKTMLKTKDIFVDERLNMLVMRDTPEVIKIAEKLIAANDLEDPEVMLDIEVLEVSRNRLQELGIIYPNQLSVVTADALTLESLKAIKSTNIGVSPNPAINFKKTTGDVNLLSNPRIRVKNNEKAKILVGDKVPIITTTSTANVGISENVQYVDVGLKLDVEPRVTLDNFVNIKVGLEVSSLGERTVTRNGATVYTIGTRNASTVLRLKNGETQVLAGLILDDERKNASKLPGLGDLPLIGRLFSNQEDKKSKTEIVLAITPRIIGNITRPQVEITEYWSGTESFISDKPQVNFPPTGGLENPQDRIREQMRLRQLQLNENQETPASQEPTPEPILDPAPQQNSSQDGQGVLEQPATDPIQPPAVNPIAAPEAIPSVIDSSGRLRPATQ